jgi:Flavin containing amine oxidoreductase
MSAAAPRVTVAGGGLAGMTAALRLAERGYRVKLYEQKSMLGGNLGSRTLTSGTVYDVYPHMYLGWYANFWRMMADVGVDREARFRPFDSVRQLTEGEYPKFAKLINSYDPRHVFEDLTSGWAPLPDMVVYLYAGLELLAERHGPALRLHNVSLNGYLNSRWYMTDGAERAYETFITRVWAIPSYLVAAHDYATYLTYCYGEEQPSAWLARGPAEEVVIAPLEAALLRHGVQIHRNVEVTRLVRGGDRVNAVQLRRSKFNPRTYMWEPTGEAWTERVDELIMSVPAPTLARLVRSGRSGQRVVEADKTLARLTALRTERVPILHACFKGRLELPPEPVGLRDSHLNIAFTDISQTWERTPGAGGQTVCAVSCSETDELSGATPIENGYQVLRELADYLEFSAGDAWGDSPDIDWAQTRYHENLDAELSLNAVGTGAFRPRATCGPMTNLYFGGDFCHTHTGLTTIESAVASGLAAAAAVVERRGGTEVGLESPRTRSASEYRLLCLAFAPWVAGARALAAGSDYVRSTAGPTGAASRADNGASAARAATDGADSYVQYLLTPGLPARHQRFDS